MTVAAVIENRAAQAQARPEPGHIVSVDILNDLAQAETIWRGLEASELSTPYQRFDFLSQWQRHVGQAEGLRPFVIIACDAECRPLLLLPLALKNETGVRVARFMGGKHATFNMGLWNRDFAAAATKADLDTLISAIREHAKADVLALTQQPQRWMDLPNPLALLPNQASANDCPLMTIEPGAAPAALVSNSFRRRLKGKERKLEALPGYGYRLAATNDEIKRLLDWFFVIKPQRMAEQKLPNVFADPGVEDFIRDACMAPLASGGHAIDIHALECDDEVIAIFAGVADGHRFSMMFNTYTLSGNSKFSPGLILMRNIIDYYAERGYRSLDLGIGSDDYKRLFCKGDETIFDSFIPLSLRGNVAAAVMSGVNRVKRTVKQTPALMQIAQRARSVLQR